MSRGGSHANIRKGFPSSSTTSSGRRLASARFCVGASGNESLCNSDNFSRARFNLASLDACVLRPWQFEHRVPQTCIADSAQSGRDDAARRVVFAGAAQSLGVRTALRHEASYGRGHVLWRSLILHVAWRHRTPQTVASSFMCTLDEQGHNLPLWGTDSYTSTSTLFNIHV